MPQVDWYHLGVFILEAELVLQALDGLEGHQCLYLLLGLPSAKQLVFSWLRRGCAWLLSDILLFVNRFEEGCLKSPSTPSQFPIFLAVSRWLSLTRLWLFGSCRYLLFDGSTDYLRRHDLLSGSDLFNHDKWGSMSEKWHVDGALHFKLSHTISKPIGLLANPVLNVWRVVLVKKYICLWSTLRLNQGFPLKTDILAQLRLNRLFWCCNSQILYDGFLARNRIVLIMWV